MANPFQVGPQLAPSQPEVGGTPISFIPSQRYVDKGLAPEKSLSYEDVAHLAQARKVAETNGVLSPDLGAKMLPMAMVEGRSGNFGYNETNKFYASPKNVDTFKKMGLDVQDEQGLMRSRSYNQADNAYAPDFVVRKDKNGDKFIESYEGNKMGEDKMAKVMAATLAIKHMGNQTGDPNETVKLFNGKGKGGFLGGDTDQYLSKVQEAERMLHHPANTQLRNHYFRFYR